MSRPGDHQTQVLIVGGGPVGMGLAIELGQRGVRCLLVERYHQPQRIPKGQNLTQRTLEHFHFWQAEQDLRAARTIPQSFGIGGIVAYGTLLGGYSYDWLQRELVREFYYTDNERLPQYATEAVLRRRASRIPAVDTRYGWSAETIAQEPHGVTVAIAECGGDRRDQIRADYVVGCDGSRSGVRERAGLTQTRSDHDRQMVLLVFRSESLHRLLASFPGKSFFNVLHPDLKGYWQFFGRVDLEGTWFFHAPVPAGTTRDNFDFRHYLTTAVGAAFDMEIEYAGFWDLRFAVADTYRAGRIFIAGDAAHSHPPYGGYGINTGLEDAVNLGWKLAADFEGWGGPDLLDSYSEERQAVFASTARAFIEKAIHADRDFLQTFSPERDREAFEREWTARQSGARTEVGVFEPHYEGSSVVWGLPGTVCSAVGAHALAARAGHHLAPMTLFSGRNVYEALGARFTLLVFDAEEADVRAFAEAADSVRVPLTIVRDDRREGRERYEARFIVVRPDQFVAWASMDPPDDPAAILKRAIGHASHAGRLRARC
jgi:2-polyprenyl-6-methoxyphenol hydroxylase-like FAD-dependent oxidoreductase